MLNLHVLVLPEFPEIPYYIYLKVLMPRKLTPCWWNRWRGQEDSPHTWTSGTHHRPRNTDWRSRREDGADESLPANRSSITVTNKQENKWKIYSPCCSYRKSAWRSLDSVRNIAAHSTPTLQEAYNYIYVDVRIIKTYVPFRVQLTI